LILCRDANLRVGKGCLANTTKLRMPNWTIDMDDVYSTKKAFLEAQVRRLSSALGPSRGYKAAAASASVEDQDKLSDTMVENAIYKCILLSHSDASEPCTEKTPSSSIQFAGNTARIDTTRRIISIQYQCRSGDGDSRRRKCHTPRHSRRQCKLYRSKVSPT
jgi:Kinetochore complex Fta4 of Sim4 subunit, or CENP-50